MGVNKLLAINIRIQEFVYKVASVIRGNDGSFYFVYSSSQYVENSLPGANPIKYTYHSSGKRSRFTVGQTNKRIAEFGEELRVPIKDIESSVGTIYLSFFDINSLSTEMLDLSSTKRGYDKVWVIDSKEYKHLTIRFFLVDEPFSMRELRKKYKEVFHYSCGDINVVGVTEDAWLIDKK